MKNGINVLQPNFFGVHGDRSTYGLRKHHEGSERLVGVRVAIVILIVAVLAFAVYSYRSRLYVTPDAAEQIEKAKKR